MTPSAEHPGRFHGRGSEFALIEAEIARLDDGTGGVVLVEGGAGMGKSRLLSLAERTWVLLTEAIEGGWGLSCHANANEELVAAARAHLAERGTGS
jgi:hypothetical protein